MTHLATQLKESGSAQLLNVVHPFKVQEEEELAVSHVS